MMSYPYDDARIILALQIDHSRVAGYFAAHWGNRLFDRPEPYSSVVLAATEHDIGWWEWEMKPSTLNDKGFPLDYHEIVGAGHVPIAGGVTVPLTYCLGQTTP